MPTILCDEFHKYTVDGAPMPGVTEVLDSVLGNEFEGVPADVMEAARQRGTYVHEACCMDDEMKLPDFCFDQASIDYMGDAVAGRVTAFRKFRAITGWATILRETQFFHPSGYCGRWDFFGTMPLRGRQTKVVLDIKSGQPLKRVRLQLAGYAIGVLQEHGDTPTRASLWLKEDGTYKLDVFDKPEHRRDFDAWRTVLATHYIRKEYRS